MPLKEGISPVARAIFRPRQDDGDDGTASRWAAGASKCRCTALFGRLQRWPERRTRLDPSRSGAACRGGKPAGGHVERFIAVMSAMSWVTRRHQAIMGCGRLRTWMVPDEDRRNQRDPTQWPVRVSGMPVELDLDRQFAKVVGFCAPRRRLTSEVDGCRWLTAARSRKSYVNGIVS